MEKNPTLNPIATKAEAPKPEVARADRPQRLQYTSSAVIAITLAGGLTALTGHSTAPHVRAEKMKAVSYDESATGYDTREDTYDAKLIAVKLRREAIAAAEAAQAKALAAKVAARAIAAAQAQEVSRDLQRKALETPTAASATPTSTSAALESPSLQRWLFMLRTCESGDNYRDNTGEFDGAYQFLPSTWTSLGSAINGGYAYAYLAPPAIQDRAIIFNTERGGGTEHQNPGCFDKLQSEGFTNYPPAR